MQVHDIAKEHRLSDVLVARHSVFQLVATAQRKRNQKQQSNKYIISSAPCERGIKPPIAKAPNPYGSSGYFKETLQARKTALKVIYSIKIHACKPKVPKHKYPEEKAVELVSHKSVGSFIRSVGRRHRKETHIEFKIEKERERKGNGRIGFTHMIVSHDENIWSLDISPQETLSRRMGSRRRQVERKKRRGMESRAGCRKKKFKNSMSVCGRHRLGGSEEGERAAIWRRWDGNGTNQGRGLAGASGRMCV